MQLGIFAKTFPRPTLEATLDAVIRHDLRYVQFNMSCAGLSSLPDQIEPEILARIRVEMEARAITMAAVSGTFNMAHPDRQVREAGLRRLGVLAGACSALGTSIITLCTGTRDPDDMWRWHPDNDSPQAWQVMLETMRAAVKIAEEAGVRLAFEPERANVINNVARAEQLLTMMDSPALKVVFDPSNLIDGKAPDATPAILDDAFDRLGHAIVLAHAKDKDLHDGFVAAGRGVLNYSRYLAGLDRIGFTGALIIHGLAETEVADAVHFVRSTYAATTGKKLD